MDLVWQGNLLSIVHRANGVKTGIVLASGVRNGLYLAVPTDASVSRTEDLKGERVAVFNGTNLYLATVWALAAKGFKESNLKLISAPWRRHSVGQHRGGLRGPACVAQGLGGR